MRATATTKKILMMAMALLRDDERLEQKKSGVTCRRRAKLRRTYPSQETHTIVTQTAHHGSERAVSLTLVVSGFVFFVTVLCRGEESSERETFGRLAHAHTLTYTHSHTDIHIETHCYTNAHSRYMADHVHEVLVSCT